MQVKFYAFYKIQAPRKAARKAADSGAIDKLHKSLIEFCKSLIAVS